MCSSDLISAADERDRNVEFLSLLMDRVGEKGPLVVVGFLPPYYPARVNEGRTPRERAIRNAAGAVRRSLANRGLGLTEVEIFQEIFSRLNALVMNFMVNCRVIAKMESRRGDDAF